MQRYLAVVSVCWICLVGALHAQQVDVAFGGGSLFSSGGTYNGGALPSLSGGTLLGASGDYLFLKHKFGVQGEANWRFDQGLYANQIPYRPLFWDFNAIYVRPFGSRLAAEFLGGGGAESVRFYSGTYNCDVSGNCTNYVSNNHFMADAGAGLRLYVFHRLFIRPEVRLYIVPNNNNGGTATTTHPGFSSQYPIRYGAFLGYTFGGNRQ